MTGSLENRRLRSRLLAADAELQEARALISDLMEQVTRANLVAMRMARRVAVRMARAA